MPTSLYEMEAILPLDFLPKYVLLNFSLQDQNGRPLPLLTSPETTPISFEMVRALMADLDLRCGDGKSTACTFVQRLEPIVFALVATGQGEITARLKRLRDFPRHQPNDLQFHTGMLQFFQDGLQQFTGETRLGGNLIDISSAGIRETYPGIMTMTSELREVLGGRDGFYEPLLNPLTLVVDFMKAHSPQSSEEIEVLMPQFFQLCQRFTRDLVALVEDNLRFWPMIGVLNRMSRYYVAYARMTAPIGRDFMVKLDQLIPNPRDWSWREAFHHPLRSWQERRYQWYPFPTGETRSSHVEVSCEHPIELEQVPGKAKIRAGTGRVSANDVFGRASYETKEHQHFYTNKTQDQIRRILEANHISVWPQGGIFGLELGIEYAVERSTNWGHSLILLTVAAAAAFLVKIYEPTTLQVGQVQFLAIVPVVLGLFAALASLRPQEKITASRMRKRRFAVLGFGFFMAGYFLVGLVRPKWFAAFWCLMGRIRNAIGI